MAHNLSLREDGTAEMFSGNNETPWLGLGRVIPGTADRSNVLELAGLDWTVSEVPMLRRRLGKLVAVEGAKLLQRDDNGAELGVVGKKYGVLQNGVLADLMDAVAQFGARYVTAGALNDGKQVWFLMDLSDIAGVKSIAGDEHGKYVLGLTSHDRSFALTLRRIAIRVVCANTLSWGLAQAKHSGSPVYRVAHTTNAKSRVDEARKALGLTIEYFDAFDVEVAKLMDTPADFEFVVDTIAPEIKADAETSKTAATGRAKLRSGLWDAYVSDLVGEQWHGTAWGAVQAVHSYELWGKAVKAKGGDAKVVRWESQARSVLTDHMVLTDQARKLLLPV